MVLGMVARGLGRSLLKGRKKKVSTEKLMGSRSKEGGGGAVKEKGGALAVRPSMGLVPTAQDLAPVSTTPGESDIVIIKKQVIQVRDILKDTQSAKQKERVSKRKAVQEEKRKTREEKIEKPKAKPKESKTAKMPTIPGLGIGNWLQWVAFGVILNKLVELMPLLKKIFNVIRPIAKFLITAFEKFVEFVVGGIDLAYKGIDALKTGLKAIGGEGAVELFNKFGKLFTAVLNGALIAALVAARSGMFKRKPGAKPKGPKSKWRKGLEKRWKKSKFGKFFRNKKAGWKKLTRKISRGRIGRTLKALRPKNVGKFIMEGGVDKALKGGVKNVINFAKKVKPGKTIQNLTKNIKNIKPVKTLQNLNPFKGMNLGKQASNLWKGAKQLGSKALGGLNKFAKNQMGKLGSMWKGAKAWGAKQAAKLGNIVELAKNPKKLMELMKGKLTKSIDGIVKKNKTLKNILSMAKNPKKIGGAIRGMLNTAKKSKGILNVRAALSRAKAAKIGGVDKVIAAVMGLIDYMALKESPINAIVKAVSGMLGYAAGFAIGAPFGGMPGFITGMAGGALGELAGYGLLKGLAKGFPGLTQVVDPIMGAGPDGDGRPILRDPDGPMDHMLNQPKEEGKKTDIKSNQTGSSAEGLDTKPSYGGDGMVVIENTTTYIQPIEV